MSPRAVPAAALLFAAALASTPAPAVAQARDWKDIPAPPLRAFDPPEPQRIELPNGMVIFLLEDHELPLVNGFVRVRGGSRAEPAAKVGLVEIYGEAWRTGGTRERTGDELDDFLEARAARVETSGGLDSTTVSFSCLSGDLAEVVGAFLAVLRQPAFREDKIALAKHQLEAGIARRNDSPGAIAAREARKLGYGAESPYARTEEYATVAAVSRDDLVAWHRTHVHPNNMVLGVVGDFEPKALEATLRKAFASWPQGPAPAKVEVEFQNPRAGIYFVQKDDVNQSNIRMVHLGLRRDNPDYHAVEVMNEILGGGFSARLFSNIRSKRGLAYAVGGGVGTAFDHPGLFQVSMGTKSESTAAAIEALYAEIKGFLETDPPTAEELARAKEAILNSFVFRFDSRQKVLAEKVLYEFHGYPLDFLERYRAGIEKVTVEDVTRVARRYILPDKIALLVVGRSEDFDKPLSSFGAVTRVDIAIPGSPGGGSGAPGGRPGS